MCGSDAALPRPFHQVRGASVQVRLTLMSGPGLKAERGLEHCVCGAEI